MLCKPDNGLAAYRLLLFIDEAVYIEERVADKTLKNVANKATHFHLVMIGLVVHCTCINHNDLS